MGWPSVAWGLQHISSRELTEWRAYEEVAGPVGSARLDHHFATLMALIANMMRGKGDPVVKPEDFLPWLQAHTPFDATETDKHPAIEAFEALWAAKEAS